MFLIVISFSCCIYYMNNYFCMYDTVVQGVYLEAGLFAHGQFAPKIKMKLKKT